MPVPRPAFFISLRLPASLSTNKIHPTSPPRRTPSPLGFPSELSLRIFFPSTLFSRLACVCQRRKECLRHPAGPEGYAPQNSHSTLSRFRGLSQLSSAYPVPSSVTDTPERNVKQVRRRATRARRSVPRRVPRDFFRRRGRPQDGPRLCLRHAGRSIG